MCVPEAVFKQMGEPFISVIIPAKNAEKTIARCLISVLGLDYADYEVIVVDDGSQDQTAQILQNFAQRLKIISFSQSVGPAKARNEAAKQAKGGFIAFTDADCLTASDWLRELLKGFQDDNIAGTGGMQKVPDDETAFGRRAAKLMQQVGFLTDYLRPGQQANISVNHNPSCNVMYKRDIFLKEGGFLEGLWPGEDVELDYRLRKSGYELIFNPRAIVYHYRPEDLKSFLKMMFRYGWAQGFLIRKRGILRKIHIVSALGLFFLALFLGLAFYYPLYAGIVLVSALVIWLIFLGPDLVLSSGLLFWFMGFCKSFILSR
jgi:GT2 family glycosyltransferase